jgi:hypothetical protein
MPHGGRLLRTATLFTGKKYVGECWNKQGSKKRSRAEKKALKAAAELSQAESGEDAGSEVEESDDN